MIICIRTHALYLLLALSLSWNVAAQEITDIEIIQQQSDRLIQHQEQQLSEELRERERQQKRTTIESPSLPPQQTQPESAGLCFNIDSIEVDGVSNPFIEDVNLAASGFLNKCLSLYSINSLLRKITLIYLDQGFITTRAYLPQQNLSQGVLRVQVIEGKVEKIDQSSAPEINLQTVFPGVSGKILNLRDIEQGLDQLNRLGANRVVMELTPGNEVGASIIRLANQRNRRWQASVRHDNHGQPSTGEQQTRVKASLDDPLQLNDYLSLSAQGEPFEDSDAKKSENLSLRYELPFGYWMFSLDAYRFQYESRVQGETEVFTTSGQSDNITLTASRVFARDKNSKTELLASLMRKSSKNFVEDVLLETSSRVLGIGMLEGRYRHYYSGHRSLGLALAYKRGLSVFTDIGETSADGPQADYAALLFELDFSTQLSGIANTGRYLGSIAMQHSDDRLFGSEQFSIGGLYSVRGFREESLSENSGAFLRNEYHEPVAIGQNFLNLHWITPFAAFDVGAVKTESESAEWQTLSGVAAGLRLSGRYLNADMTYTKAIQRPSTFKADKSQLYFSLTLNL